MFLGELLAGKDLAKGPVRGDNVVGQDSATVAGGHLKGQALSVEVSVALPVLTPVSGHGHPVGSGTFDGNCLDIAGTSNVGDKDEVEVGVAVHSESDASFSSAWDPACVVTHIFRAESYIS